MIRPIPDRSSTPLGAAPQRVERVDTVVIGAGQAGLAAGHYLAARDADFIILDAEERVGDNWRQRWDSLRLFTPAAYSGLPGMPFPAPPAHLADKDEVADYLERYAERFDLPVRLRTRVERLGWNGDRYVLATSGGRIESHNVIVATGPFQRPHIPDVAKRLSDDIHQVHSSEYHNPLALPDGPALVVGAGNSGAQIALELSKHRQVWLAGRNTGHLPRRLLGRDIFDWIWPVISRVSMDSRLGRRIIGGIRGGDALIGIPERSLADAGIARVGRITGERNGLPIADGVPIEPRVIVWCTGFESDYSWIDLPILDEAGRLQHRRGAVTGAPGLFFLGLRMLHRINSSLIGGVAADAEYVAGLVAERSGARAAAPLSPSVRMR
jgi:putative flavoprotein involved in K+ transport